MLTRRAPRHHWVASFPALLLCLAACATPTQPSTPGTPRALASATATDILPLVTITPLPAEPSPSETVAVTVATQTPVESLATATPSPTPAGPCRDNLHFVADITVPDGTQFLPGAPIDKQWRVRNTGTCDWGPDYRLVLVSGNAMGAASAAALYPAKAGNEAIIELTMVAPQAPGQYTGRRQARSPSARLFGDRVFITINVITPTVTATATP